MKQALLRHGGVAVLGMALLVGSVICQAEEGKKVSPVLDFKVKSIDGKDVYLGDYQGDVLLIVNVASKCGLTPQYEGLEQIYRRYKDKGFKILAFPANNFREQEPGTNEEIKEFCSSKYDVTFDLFSKISVKGDDQADLYSYLTHKDKNGKFDGDIEWNFQKFLVGRDGQLIAKFSPKAAPLDKEITDSIEKALEAPKG